MEFTSAVVTSIPPGRKHLYPSDPGAARSHLDLFNQCWLRQVRWLPSNLSLPLKSLQHQ